jgi:hypothetical protein
MSQQNKVQVQYIDTGTVLINPYLRCFVKYIAVTEFPSFFVAKLQQKYSV